MMLLERIFLIPSESMEKFLLEIDRIRNEETLQELKIRMLNDKMMLLERIFLIPSGLPGRPIYRHLLFSPAKFNAYAGSVLPGLRDLTHGFEKLEEDQKLKKVDEAKKTSLRSYDSLQTGS